MTLFRLGYFFICLFIGNAVFGQPNDNKLKIDSLATLLKSYKILDTQKVDILNELGYEYWIINPDISEKYGSEALEIAKILPYEKGKAYANRVIGVAHWARGNLDLSFKFLLDAEASYKAIKDSLGLGNSALNLGMAYADQSNFTNALQKYEYALSIFQRLGEESRVATTYTKMAEILIRNQDFQNAYDHLAKALDIHKSHQFLYGIAEVNGKMGKVAMERKLYNDAISYFLMAVDAATQRNDHVGLADYYQSIGFIFYKKRNYQQCIAYLAKSKKLAEKYNLKKVKKELYKTYQNVEKDRGNYKSALFYAERYCEVEDELFNKEKSHIISSMEARRTFDENEQELKIAQKNLELLTQKNKTKNLTNLVLFLGLLAIVALSWGLIQRKNKKLIQSSIDLDQAILKTDKLQNKVEIKEQELISYTLNFAQKNELIATLKSSLDDLKSDLSKEKRVEILALQRKLESVIRIDEDWNDFKMHFENLHPQLIRNLNQKYPNLTKNEFKLIALLRLNLSSKEISSILGISPDSVKTARYRLRKKLGIDNHQKDIFTFLLEYDQ